MGFRGDVAGLADQEGYVERNFWGGGGESSVWCKDLGLVGGVVVGTLPGDHKARSLMKEFAVQ